MRRLARWSRLARVLLITQYAYMLEYRVETALWALSGLVPLLMMSLWIHQADMVGGPGGMAAGEEGLSRVELARYFISAFIVRQFTVAWVVYAFEEDALLGRLSPFLLQPLHPLWRYVASHLAEQLSRLPFALVIVVVFFAIQPGSFWLPNPGQLLLAWLATLASFTISFLLQSLIASLCFWSEKASALERLLTVPMLFFSGLLAPIAAFPAGVRAIAQWTPFPWLIDFPARLLAGLPVNAGFGFLVQLGWIALLLPLTLGLWRSGVRRYTAMGA